MEARDIYRLQGKRTSISLRCTALEVSGCGVAQNQCESLPQLARARRERVPVFVKPLDS